MKVDCSHSDRTQDMDNDDVGVFINPICFSEPYNRIAGKEGYTNYELNEVLAQSIYDNIQNNIDYVVKTQHTRNGSNKYKVFSIDEILKSRNKHSKNNKSLPVYFTTNQQIQRSKTLDLKNLKQIPESLKTRNSLKHEPNHIQISQRFPTINTIELDKYGIFEDSTTTNNNNNNNNNSDIIANKMYNQRYNEYPPMNGLGYNHYARNNGGGYATNTNNKDVSNFTLQQHNMHGGNDLMFADGSVPYGFYDQSNFTGTNHLVCGAVQNDPRFPSRGNGSKDAYGMNYPPYYPPGNGYSHAPPMAPQLGFGNGRRINTGYNHECNYNAGSAFIAKPRSACSTVSEKENRRDFTRKNVSKVKKGAIDINIETAASSRQGLSIDLNIGVGN